MVDLYDELQDTVLRFDKKYDRLDETLTLIKLAPDKWTLREIMGHLIDSASNNHQRFVRLQMESVLDFPGYGDKNEQWIQIQQYNKMSFHALLKLWVSYNLFLCHVIQYIDPGMLHHVWKAKKSTNTLGEISLDYLRHLKEHLIHFEDRLKEVRVKRYGK